MGDVTRLLITGTGRCGTRWMADCLRAAGVRCGHERAFNQRRQGKGSWVAESSWKAAPHLGRLGADTYVVHLVRHPLDTIASRLAWGSFSQADNPNLRYAAKWFPELLEMSPGDRCAYHWVWWNQMIGRSRPRRVGEFNAVNELLRIEDVGAQNVLELADLVIRRRPRLGATLPERSNRSPRRALNITWDDVRHVPGLLELAACYGYLDDGGTL